MELKKNCCCHCKPNDASREVRLVFDAYLTPQETKPIIVITSVLFSPKQIVIVQDHELFELEFTIGNKCQYWIGGNYKIPGCVFQPMEYPISCNYDLSKPATDLTFIVTNISSKPARFVAHLSGQELLI